MAHAKVKGSHPPIWPDKAWKQSFRRRLLAWYRAHRRDLPWRRTRDPYAIWVSEIMLQQTQVATVIPYYERFLAAFPDARALAAAAEQEVLKHWEGLGYYRRARQMWRAAQVICDEHGGNFPRRLAAVRQLPGIGRYTAAAVVSIAYDEPAAILEANTARLFARLLAYREDVSTPAGQSLLWRFAEELLPKREAGAFNQGLMELGSLVCAPRVPRCDACPLQRLCPTHAGGLAEVIPAPRAKPRFEAVREASVVVWRNGKVLLRKRNAGERWEGLWDYPRFALLARGRKKTAAELATGVAELVGVVIELEEHLTTIKHGVTRFRITLDCYAARYVSTERQRASNRETIKWVDPADLEKYPLSTSARKLSRLLTAKRSAAPQPTGSLASLILP